jgi:hypothetical protein
MNTTNNHRNETIRKLLLRLELWFAPLLLLIPLIVSLVFIGEWYTKGFLSHSSQYNGALLIGMLLLIGNLVFDIPFLRSLRMLKKKQ